MHKITADSTLRCLEAVSKSCTVLQFARHTSRLSTIRVVKRDRCWGLGRLHWDIENDGLAGSTGQNREEMERE